MPTCIGWTCLKPLVENSEALVLYIVDKEREMTPGKIIVRV